MDARVALREYRGGDSIKTLMGRYGLSRSTIYERLRNVNGGHSLTGRTRPEKLSVCGNLSLRNQAVKSNMNKEYRILGDVLGLSPSTIRRIASKSSR